MVSIKTEKIVATAKTALLMGGMMLLYGCGGPQNADRIGHRKHVLCPVPAPAGGAAFLMGSLEISVAEYAAYLNENPPAKQHPQIVCAPKGCRPSRGLDKHPAAHVSRTEAENFCYWLSRKTGRTVRLPTAAEWEHAARGGLNGSDYPWGWGSPSSNACFRTEGPVECGQYDPNPYGLHDMAGNVAEWCSDNAGSQLVALGGSWAERSEELLRVDRCTLFPPDYSDADVGFRILVER